MRSPVAQYRKPAFTLIELLVVVAILGLLSAIVIPNIAGNMNSRRYREGARSVSSFVSRCQSRSIGAAAQRGVMLQPLAPDPAACLDLYYADTPPTYSGETLTSVASVPKDSYTASSEVIFDNDTKNRLAIPGFCTAGDAIQFGGVGPKYKFIPPASVTMWFEDNQNIRNSSWPRATGLPFRIWRQPSRGTGGALQLQKGAAVDLPWCCLGTRAFRDFMNPGGGFPVAPISILFDSSGKPSEIVHSGGQRTSVGSPIFLLLGESELAGNGYNAAVAGSRSLPAPEDRVGANWQYTDCVWLCIDNHSGVVRSANVFGGATTVLDSQRSVRMGIAYAGGEK
jgi:prepilin-type N-terminal cleavage/methylation domain-containing protein